MTKMKTATEKAMMRLAILALASTTAYADTFHVSNLNDSGSGSLRAAITAANLTPDPDTILFDVSGTISLATTLPSIVTQMTIDGSGQNVTIDGGGAVRIFATSSPFELRYLTLAHGAPSGLADDGGAIASNAKLTVAYCTFRDNVAPHNGGAINHGSSALTVHHSTFVHNSARFGGAMSVSGGANISNSTFSQNHADWAVGAMVFDGISAPSSTLTNVTIYANSAGMNSGSMVNLGGSAVLLSNVIMGGSTKTECENPYGGITAVGVNLIQDGSCGIPNTLGDPMLDALATNGGATMTHALKAGSPAIGAGNTTVCAADPVNNLDQRDQPRGARGKCDLGAYEAGSPFPFTGFFAPISITAVNSVNAGRAIPVKFSLGGNQGLNIFASGSPTSVAAVCSTMTPGSDVQAVDTSANSSLSYDPATNTYTYLWKTEKSWTGCRQFRLQLTDGTIHTAMFDFH